MSRVSTEHKSSIEALCISCMGDNLIPVQKDGTPNYNCIFSFDNRSTEEVQIVRDAIGEKTYFETTGSPLTTTANLCKILWLRRHEPEVFRSTWKLMTFADYTLLRMGFPPQIDYSMASRNIFDIRKRKYPDSILKEFGLTNTLFSDPVPSAHIVGEITSNICNQLRLSKGVKVIAGGVDLAFGVLGVGVSTSTPKTAANIAGTFEHAAYISKVPITNRTALKHSVISCCNVIEGSYLVFRGLFTAGAAIKWFREEFALEERITAEKEGKNVYDIMLEPLEFNGGNIFVLPYFAGSWTDSSVSASILGLTLSTKRENILAGILEGITHELRSNIEILESLINSRLDRLRAGGGLTKSKKFLQLKADISGRVVELVSIKEASALGAALLAGVATGVYNSVEDAIGNIVEVTDYSHPRDEFAEIYNAEHNTYKELVRILHALPTKQ
ncbi:L-fuculokinase [Chloroflexota bacterium]